MEATVTVPVWMLAYIVLPIFGGAIIWIFKQIQRDVASTKDEVKDAVNRLAQIEHSYVHRQEINQMMGGIHGRMNELNTGLASITAELRAMRGNSQADHPPL